MSTRMYQSINKTVKLTAEIIQAFFFYQLHAKLLHILLPKLNPRVVEINGDY
jgi:hypothetical protein